MAKYIKKSFAPHIYQDWIHLFKQCSAEQRSELLLAITDYPNYEPTIDISIWDFIKSQLAVQYQTMENKSQTMSDNRNKSRPKSTEVDQSQPMTTEVDKCSQIEIETGIENDEYKDIVNNISRFINEYTLFKAGFQGWVFPPEIRKVARQHWSADEVRNIEKDFSCHEYETQTSINDLLQTYPPKPKTTRFVKPTLEEVKAYCRERMNMVDAEKFMNYYESNGWKVGKNPMKDWKAAVRTWEKHNPKAPEKTTVNFTELVELWNDMAARLKLQPVSESDLMPERKAEIEKIIATKKPKDLPTLVAQLEQVIKKSPKLLGRQDDIGVDGRWFTRELGWQASFAFCFSTKGWSDIMAGKYNGEMK